jgi:glutamate racemase
MGSIGFFDSGYGGLTVLQSVVQKLPQYDYVYLGDNARAPYGNRSFETVYEYTLQCVNALIELDCTLIVLACNTASAKALRTIQQVNLPLIKKDVRVLGVIRPSTEVIGTYSKSGHVGILATSGTVESLSYVVEIQKFFPSVKVFQQACPMWVPLIENGEHHSVGAAFFVRKYTRQLFDQSGKIDTVLLGCTHYPLMYQLIKENLPQQISLLAQGDIVANSLADYLSRHAERANALSKMGTRTFYTTDDTSGFDFHATDFFGEKIHSRHIAI